MARLQGSEEASCGLRLLAHVRNGTRLRSSEEAMLHQCVHAGPQVSTRVQRRAHERGRIDARTRRKR